MIEMTDNFTGDEFDIGVTHFKDLTLKGKIRFIFDWLKLQFRKPKYIAIQTKYVKDN